MFQLSISDCSPAQSAPIDYTYIVHDDVIISPPIEIIVVFIFAVAALSTKIAKFCTIRVFSLGPFSTAAPHASFSLMW